MATYVRNGHTIQTCHEYPPIPIRTLDWSAVLDGHDGTPDAKPQPHATGPTEEAAIADLLEQLDEGDEALAEP